MELMITSFIWQLSWISVKTNLSIWNADNAHILSPKSFILISDGWTFWQSMGVYNHIV